MKSYGAEIVNDPTLLKLNEEWEVLKIDQQGATINDVNKLDSIVKTIKNRTRNDILGYIFIKQAYKTRYGNIIQGPEN